MRRLLILIASALMIVAGVALSVRKPSPAQATPVVLAAASLQESLEAAADAWTAKGHQRPVLSFAATSALARQVEAGAPADLLISADEEWMDTLSKKGLIRQGSRGTLLRNGLVLIAPVSSNTDLTIGPGMPLAQALGDGRLALADPTGVPAGRYAKQALEKLGVWDAVSARVAAGDNVRAALSLVARGEAPLGVVYATDAKVEPRVRVIGTFPPASLAPITYPVALLETTRAPEAEPLRRFLLSPEAQSVFQRYGFTPGRAELRRH